MTHFSNRLLQMMKRSLFAKNSIIKKTKTKTKKLQIIDAAHANVTFVTNNQ